MRVLNKEILIGFAQAYLSYLFRDPDFQRVRVRGIYLFGSVARGDFDEKSDVDIFLDTEKGDEKALEKAVKRALKRFLGSEEYKKFALQGVRNSISPLVGRLESWELKGSVAKEGLVLFAVSPSFGLEKYFLLCIEPISKAADRNRVMRRLAGRKEKHFQGKGMISDARGQSLGTRVFLVPAENIHPFLKLFSEEKVNYRMIEIWR